MMLDNTYRIPDPTWLRVSRAIGVGFVICLAIGACIGGLAGGIWIGWQAIAQFCA
jgi:hypothetical protein